MTTENENTKDEQEEESKPTEKMSSVELMEKMLRDRGHTIIKVTPPKGWCQVIFKG